MQGVYEKLTSRQAVQDIQQEVGFFIEVFENRQAAERAALIQLEAAVVDAACDDPGLDVVHDLMLPLIRERLLAKAAQAQPTGVAPGSTAEVNLDQKVCQKCLHGIPLCLST